MSRWIGKFGLPLLIIVLAIGLAVWAHQSSASLKWNQDNYNNTIQQQSDRVNSDNWPILRNSNIGISFRYPDETRLTSFNVCIMGASEIDSSSHWNVVVDNPNNSLDPETNTNYEIIFFENISKKSCSLQSVKSLDAKAFAELIRKENLDDNSPFIPDATVGEIESYQIGGQSAYRLAVTREYNFLGESGVLHYPRIYIMFENRVGDVVVAVYSEHQSELAKAILETVTIN